MLLTNRDKQRNSICNVHHTVAKVGLCWIQCSFQMMFCDSLSRRRTVCGAVVS